MKTLCVDVGNTLINVGVFNETELEKNSFFITKTTNFSKVFEDTIKKLVSKDTIKDCVISSVVDNLNKKMESVAKKFIKGKVIFIDQTMLPNKFFGVSSKGRKETGSDLLCDVVHANNLYKGNKLIIDLGTASKVIFVEKDIFKTVFIFPGTKMMLDSLSQGTFKLPKLGEYFCGVKELPKDTEEVLWTSVYFSVLGTIKELIENFKRNIGKDFKLIMGGGYSVMFKSSLKYDCFEKDLTLKGCYELYKTYIIKGE